MNKNGVIAVVVVVTAVVLLGLWAMRSGQQGLGRGVDCERPPAPPTNVSATAASDVVTINWSPPQNSEVVTTFILEGGSTPGANNSGTFVAPGTSTSFQRQAPPGTYYVRMFARNACGTSGPSSEVTVTVAAP